MRFMSKAEAQRIEAPERLYTVEKRPGGITIVADVSENLNLTDEQYQMPYPNEYRVELYGWYGGNWELDLDLLCNPEASALGEACGANAGGIAFDYEDEDSWRSHENAIACMFDNVPAAFEQVVVLDDLSELCGTQLENGVWHVVVPEGACL